ncbi:Phosphoglycerol transferase MdoB [Clostridium grantii DSM 8605]|uniref:Phosphoglycerol transferase MdoB n=1 Tax=Clostridium grantii DSM 8605 TaxID=1121316 RepID=A0A1M5UKE8_9CLOT|nr:Phosphoglycerol transferase MdoB [Clostridium grantii DSM 8605]
MIQLLITLIFLVFFIELLCRNTFTSILNWIKGYSFYFYANIFSLWCVLSIFIFITNNSKISILALSSIALILGYVNKYKFRFRGDPLFPWDLKLKKESSNMSSYIKDFETIKDIITGIFILSLIYVICPNISFSIITRLLCLFLSLIFFTLILWRNLFASKLLFNVSGLNNHLLDQHKFYSSNGFVLAFLLNIKDYFIPKINNHEKNKFTSNLKKNDIENKSSEKKPNTIVIMNESFWDPTLIKTLEFSKELTPTLNKLRETSFFGYMVSPEFGGGTSNIEFEILTGNSMYFLPTGSMAFQSYLRKPVESIPYELKKIGYDTIGIHSYERWFWKRENAYDLMGFDKFISCESFKNPEVKGLYISDMEFSKKIIEVYENSKNPLFLYGVTMQNHGPHDGSRYKKFDINVKAPLNNKALGELKSYSQGIHDADKALKYLIDYFKNVKEPTNIVFFGDHLPMLGKNFSTFVECGYIKNNNPTSWSYEEKLKMVSTPFLMWSNYKNEKKDLGHISACSIGCKILESISLEPSPYFRFLNELYKKYPVLCKRVPQIFKTAKDTKDFEELTEKYKQLQYNQLFGQDIDTSITAANDNLPFFN